jgi:hypothetical protein
MRIPLLRNANAFAKMCVEGNLTLAMRTDGFGEMLIIFMHTPFSFRQKLGHSQLRIRHDNYSWIHSIKIVTAMSYEYI